jgi:hypothetical protein
MRRRLEQVGIVSGMTLAAVNLWTGVPLLGLWVGSRAVGDEGTISMLAVLVVVATMFLAGAVVIRSLGFLEDRYRVVTGRGRTVHRQLPWLRSMRGARAHEPDTGRPSLDALDYVLVMVVVACVAAFEVWFFFFSGSSLDQRSGR